jgi:hypothetical protein
MTSSSSEAAPAPDATSVPTHVVESALALVRAELKLVFIQARVLIVSALLLAGGALAAAFFFGLALILAAAAPALGSMPLGTAAPAPVFLALGVALALALAGGVGAFLALRRLRSTAVGSTTGAPR